MTQVPDEMLMAYADGELDAADRAEVEALVQRDSAAAARLDAFVRSGRTLGQLFDQPMHEPVPARLLETVRTAPMQPIPAQQTGRQGVVTILKQALLGRTGTPAQLATAVVFSMVVAGGAMVLKLNGTAGTSAGERLKLALETAPSRPGKDAPPGIVTPVLSFVSVGGEFCRQYVQPAASGKRIEGVGCRTKTGEWRIEAQAVAAGPGPDNSVTRPSAGPGEASVEATVDRLIKGIPFDPKDEAKLIAKHWQAE